MLRRAATVGAGAVLVVAIAGAGLFLWLARYVPLHALDSGFAPGPGVGADVQPVTGSGGRPVYFPAVRGSGHFDVAFTLRNTGRFTVTVRGLEPARPASAPWIGPTDLRATTSATASAERGELLPLQNLRLARGDTAILVVRFDMRCVGATRSSPDVYADRVRLRYRYLSVFTRTQTVRLPFAVTLRCVGGPPANP